MPQYGGHDPVAIAGNVARAGHPDVWAIHNDRLFLFYSDDARRQFNADPAHTALQADANWPQCEPDALAVISRTLPRPWDRTRRRKTAP